MGVVNKDIRLEALSRQKLLHENRCCNCPYRDRSARKTISDECVKCPVYHELLEIGEVLLGTSRKRKSVVIDEVITNEESNSVA